MRSQLIHFTMMVGMCLAAGCASTQLYPGARRTPQEVGVLKMATNGAITSIAGRKLEGRAYELLPSEYPIKFRIIVQGEELGPMIEGRGTFKCEALVTIEAGHEYRITRTTPKFLTMKSGGPRPSVDKQRITYGWSVYIVDYDLDGKQLDGKEVDCDQGVEFKRR